MGDNDCSTDAEAEIRSLRRRLMEAEDTLYAIQAGEVDAVVVNGAAGDQIYTLESPDQPFRVFVEQMQEGALTINGEGTIIYCNSFFANLVGKKPSYVRGQLIDQFVASDLQSFHELIESASASVVHSEGWLHGANETKVPVQFALNPLPPQSQKLVGLVVTDLSARELAKMLETQRLAAEEAKASRDQFLAVVSHELRTPLNAVLGWTQKIRLHDDLPIAIKRGLEIIESNAWNQAQLIDDLLDVTRILTGKLTLQFSEVDLLQVIHDGVAVVQPSGDRKDIPIHVSSPKENIIVRADLDRLHQIINNLLSNAVKYTNPGGEIKVSLELDDQFAVLHVIDNGVGIEKNFLPRLFEMYQQRNQSANRSGGLGLGLAIVKELTLLHGGEITATSEGEGQGSTFTVRLPVGEQPLAKEKVVDPEPIRVTNLKGVNILLVEDNNDARELLAELLTEYHAGVIAVSNAEEALHKVVTGKFDILVSDISLPNMSGIELIHAVRERGFSGRELPAIALTAYASREDKKQMLAAGFQLHLSKPVDLTKLCNAIAQVARIS